MNDPEAFIQRLERNNSILQQQVAGLTHAESIIQVEFPGRCLNWIVGHLVTYRDEMLRVLGAQPIWDADRHERYSLNLADDHRSPPPVAFAHILDDWCLGQNRLLAQLQQTTMADLTMISNDGERTVGQRISALVWHETYHIGQTEIVRQLVAEVGPRP